MKFEALRYAVAALASGEGGGVLSRISPFARQSWSQEGEDLILARFMEPRTKGFYVDVGAHDPFRFSNTAYFYSRGWSGLNVEPDPDGARLLHRYRKRDTTLNMGVASVSSEMTFFRFDERALNTFNAELAQQRVERDGFAVKAQLKVPVDRLDKILATHLPPGMRIDFLTVDAEGYDFEVLKSNDWSRFRPEIVVAEIFDLDLANSVANETVRYLASVNFTLVAKASNSAFFVDVEKL